MFVNPIQSKELGKIMACPTHKLLLMFTVISDVYSCFIQNKLYLLSIVLLSEF